MRRDKQVTIGQGTGGVFANINTGTDALALFEVLNSGRFARDGIPAVNWLGTNAVTVLQVLGEIWGGPASDGDGPVW